MKFGGKLILLGDILGDAWAVLDGISVVWLTEFLNLSKRTPSLFDESN